MNSDEPIQFRFPTVRSKLQNLFPFDPKYDIQIIFRNNKYQLQTAYLRLQSAFFKNFNPNVSKVIKIQEQFNEVFFEQTMKCFYGGIYKCPRNSIFQAWRIFQYLKIESFKKQIIKDMKQNFQKYNFFQLMAFGFLNNVEQIFGNCLNILDNNNYVLLKKNKDQFLACPLQLFKFLINNHNRRPKNKRALNFIQINSILSQYSEKNQYSEDFYKELKFQLIQKTQLTAEEYRLIFIQGAKTQSNKQIQQASFTKKSLESSNQQTLNQSAQLLSSKSITSQQKQHWFEKLQCLKVSFQKGKDDYKLLHSSVEILSKSIKRKNQQSKMKQRALSKMQNSVRQIEKQINQKRQSLKKITQRIQKLQNLSGKSKGKGKQQIPQQQEQKDVFVQSHIIPGFCLGDIIGQAQNTKKQSNAKTSTVTQQPTASTANFSKKKKTFSETTQNQKQKQSSRQYMYKTCLLFDKQPISIPRKYLDNLAKIMDTDQFVKKRQLNLLFRRSKTDKSNIGDPSVIKNRPGLLVLFQTSYKKYAGGFLSVQLPTFTKADSICDYQAYIFSLTHNVKMPIMKGEQKSAISLSKHYLLSFGNDLMISNDCLNEVSYCQWPGIYQVPKYSKCTSAKDLIGTSGQFKIQQIDIYQVKNEQIQMIL